MSELTTLLNESSGLTAARDMAMCKAVADTLERHYPGHAFMIGCDHEQGMLHVQLPYADLATAQGRKEGQYGYCVKIGDLNSDPSLSLVVKAGGEMLERYRLARGKYREGDRERAMAGGLDRG